MKKAKRQKKKINRLWKAHVHLIARTNSEHADLLTNLQCKIFVAIRSFYKSIQRILKSLRKPFRVSNSLDQDQDRHFVWPGPGPNYLQMPSEDD